MMHHFTKPLLSALTVLFGFTLYSQVVINEISYNPPEAGNDSLEYIELLNTGNAAIAIGGWYFTAGVEDTFPDITLEPGEFFVTAVNAQAMMNVFGIQVHQWKSGALSNNGELIKLVDNGGVLVDSVLYDDTNPWPTEPDGSGPSLELIDSGLDNNDGTNWQSSGGATGVIINGFEVRGTPGANNSGGGMPGPAVTIDLANFSFVPMYAVVKIGDVVRWVNQSGNIHNVNGHQSFFPDNPESFVSGVPLSGPWQFDFTFNLPGTYQYRCDVHAGMGMTGTIFVYDPDNYTDFALSDLRRVDSNGSALFDGVPTSVTATVHGVNFSPPGYSFYIINPENIGINVFSFDPGPYVVTQGDLLTVHGIIDQFNGLLEIVPDDIEILSTGEPLVSPRELMEVTEDDEGSYVLSHSLEVDSVSNISAGGFNIHTSYSDDFKILIRVDADANIGLEPEFISPGEWINVTGIGTQFDSSFPFTSGYQILALEIGIVIDGIQLLDPSAIQMFPNPTSGHIRLISDHTLRSATVYALDGKAVAQNQMQTTDHHMVLSDVASGMYIVRIITDEGLWMSRLIIQQSK